MYVPHNDAGASGQQAFGDVLDGVTDGVVDGVTDGVTLEGVADGVVDGVTLGVTDGLALDGCWLIEDAATAVYVPQSDAGASGQHAFGVVLEGVTDGVADGVTLDGVADGVADGVTLDGITDGATLELSRELSDDPGVQHARATASNGC